MREARFTGLRRIEIIDTAEPEIENPHEVKVRIDRVGICGSDVHYFVHGRIANRAVQYPATLGHECAGTVVEAGAKADLTPGTRVAIDPAIVCGRCDQCLAGRSNTCRNIQFLGTPQEAPGAVADFRVLPARNCLRIPDSLSLDDAALIEPLSVGLHSVRLGKLKDGERIAVFGCGPIGLSVMLCARAQATALAIYATDLLPQRLAAARSCGADWTGAGGPPVVEQILEREPLGVDCVLECSGDPTCIDQAMRILTPGGRLVMVGIPTSPELTFDVHRMRTSELTFHNVRRQERCMEPVLQMMADCRIDASALVTHRIPLEKIEPAFEMVAAYDDGVIKAMLTLSDAE